MEFRLIQPSRRMSKVLSRPRETAYEADMAELDITVLRVAAAGIQSLVHYYAEAAGAEDRPPFFALSSYYDEWRQTILESEDTSIRRPEFVLRIPTLGDLEAEIMGEGPSDRHYDFKAAADSFLDALLDDQEDFSISRSISRVFGNELKATLLDLIKSEEMQQLCARIVRKEFRPAEIAITYFRKRAHTMRFGHSFIPACLFESPTPESLLRNLSSKSPGRFSAEALLEEQFARALDFTSAGARSGNISQIRAIAVQAPLTHAERLVAIKQFAPAAIHSVGELIDLHERRLHNQEPSAEQAKALDLLRQLHRELGALIAAADANRPVKVQTRRVQELARSVFGFVRETGELIMVAGPSLVAATSLSLASMMAIEMICGVSVSRADFWGAMATTGALAGGHSFIKAQKRNKPDAG